MRGHLPAEHTAPHLHFHHHWDECQTHMGYAPRHTEQSPHTSKHEPSCEPRRWGTLRRQPAPVPGAPWHLGPVLGPALALSRPHGERHSTATGPSMSLVKVKCCLPQPFLVLEEFLAFSLRSTNTGFAIIKFSHVTVGLLSFMLKPHSPPSPAVFPARAPRVRWCSRAAARGRPRRHSSGHSSGHQTAAYLICDTRAGKLLWRRGSEKTRFSNRCLLCSSQVTWNFFKCSFS